MRNLVLLVTVLLLPLFTGCKEMISLQMAQDQPEDIQQLLEHDEFARARQLTGKYPAIDTPELQVRIATQEVAYEDNIYTWARSLESKNDLAMLYKEQAKYQEAQDLLLEAVEGRRLKLGDTHLHRAC